MFLHGFHPPLSVSKTLTRLLLVPSCAGKEGFMDTIEKKINKTTIRLASADLTERDVDAIVNAANSHLQHGGGVAGAIVRKGGRIIQDESNKIGFVPVGNAVITTGGTLKARYVIHAVGPRMGEGDEDNKLKGAITSVLALATAKELDR